MSLSIGTRLRIASVVVILDVLAFVTVPVLRAPGAILVAILVSVPPIAVLAVRTFRRDASACSVIRVSLWSWFALLVCVYLSFAIAGVASHLVGGNETGAIVLGYSLMLLLVFGGAFAGASFGASRDSAGTS